MSEDMADSFHSFGIPSTSSFRILNPASELPVNSRRTISAPSLSESQRWDDHEYGGPSRMSIAEESERGYDEGRSTNVSSPAPRKTLPTTESSSTVRPTNAKAGTLVPVTATEAKFIKAAKRPPRVLKREVWRDMVLKSDGRDKAFVSGRQFLAPSPVSERIIGTHTQCICSAETDTVQHKGVLMVPSESRSSKIRRCI